KVLKNEAGTESRSHSRIEAGWGSGATLVGVAFVFMCLALIGATVTIASPDYWGVILFSGVTTLLADFCCVLVLRRGGWMSRWLAVLVAAPTLYVGWNLFHRVAAALE